MPTGFQQDDVDVLTPSLDLHPLVMYPVDDTTPAADSALTSEIVAVVLAAECALASSAALTEVRNNNMEALRLSPTEELPEGPETQSQTSANVQNENAQFTEDNSVIVPDLSSEIQVTAESHIPEVVNGADCGEEEEEIVSVAVDQHPGTCSSETLAASDAGDEIPVARDMADVVGQHTEDEHNFDPANISQPAAGSLTGVHVDPKKKLSTTVSKTDKNVNESTNSAAKQSNGKRVAVRLFSDPVKRQPVSAGPKEQPSQLKNKKPLKSSESVDPKQRMLSQVSRASSDLGNTSHSSVTNSVRSSGNASSNESLSVHRAIPKGSLGTIGKVSQTGKQPQPTVSRTGRVKPAHSSRSPPSSQCSSGSKTPSEANLTAVDADGLRPAPSSVMNLRTSTPLPASSSNSGTGRSSVESSRTNSQLGSMSDVSSLVTNSINECSATSGSTSHSPRMSVVASNTRKIGHSRSVASESQKPAVSRTTNGGSNLESSTVRKAVAMKRGSIAEGTSSRPPLPVNRRASVAVVPNRANGTGTNTTTAVSRINNVPLAHSNTSTRSSVTHDRSLRNKSKASPNVSSDRDGAIHRMKQSLQPDVVSNSLVDEQTSNEISRLETLCESKTKELSRLNSQLRERMVQFEAMTVVAKYFVDQLESNSCKLMSVRLEEALNELHVAKNLLDELTKQRDALIGEIQNVKQQLDEELERLHVAHQASLKQLEDDLNKRNENSLNQLVSQHNEQLSVLEANYDCQVADLRQHCNELLVNKESELTARLAEQRQEHDQNLEDMQRKHEEQLEDFSQKFELIKISLSEKVEFLRTEGEELRRREKTYMEACQRDSELRIQAALASYAHLPQEIDSLKAVLELRNSELHDLRLRGMEQQRELEEIPVARETIKRLQQKVENLEAIINIRQDYEKQLTEKHQQLLRKYERESKANKRLSMDKEELMWKLAQGDPVTPDTSRRSVSHSPTAEAAAAGSLPGIMAMSLPSATVTMRHPSAGQTLTPTSDSVVKLRRSGTYDLLSQGEDDDVVFDGSSK